MKGAALVSLVSTLLVAYVFSIQLGFSASFYPEAFPDSVKAAPVIVRGTIGMSYSDWGVNEKSGNRQLYTYYELRAQEGLKGDLMTSNDSIIIREMGGEKDGIGEHIPGTAQFRQGEDVVVFLNEKNEEGAFQVQSMMMSKLNIEVDGEGNEVLKGAVVKGEERWTMAKLRELIRQQTPAAVMTWQHSQKAVPTSESGNDVATQPKVRSDLRWVIAEILGLFIILMWGVIGGLRYMRRKSLMWLGWIVVVGGMTGWVGYQSAAMADLRPEKVFTAERAKTGAYLADGVVVGGDRAIDSTEVRGVRFSSQKGQGGSYERLVIDTEVFQEGKVPAVKRPAFFQAAVDHDLKRLTFSLWGHPRLNFKPQMLKAAFKKSTLIQKVKFFPRLEEESWTFSLEFKRPVVAEVFELSEGNPIRIIVDLKRGR